MFFIARRKDLNLPLINIVTDEPPILFGAIRSENGRETGITGFKKEMLARIQHGEHGFNDVTKRTLGRSTYYNYRVVYDNEVCATVCSSNASLFRYCDRLGLSAEDYIHVSTFPEDYNFAADNMYAMVYAMGMSVPPVMMAHIASAVKEQLLHK